MVAVPLAFQLALMLCLREQLHQVEQERAKEEYARDVASHCSALLQITLDLTVTSILVEMAHSNAESKVPPQEQPRLRHALQTEIVQLKTLVKGHPEEAKVAELDALFDPASQSLGDAKRLFEKGERITALQQVAKMRASQRAAFRMIKELLSEKQVEQQERMIAQRKAKDLLSGLLIYGAALNINIAILMVFLFNRSTTQRLNLLVENTIRLGSSKPLHPPLAGDDELAQLDQTFNKMAKELAVARKKEQDVLDKAVDAEARLRALVESLPIGLAVVNKNGLLQFANSSLYRMFSMTAKDLIGKDLSHLFRTTDSTRQVVEFETPNQFLSDLFANGREQPWELSAVRSGGATFPVEVNVTGFANNSLDQHLVIVADATQKREAERVRQEFMAMITHDLRAPLTSVKGFLEILETGMCGELNDKGRRKLGAAEGAMNNLLNLIRDLLDMERCRAGKLTLNTGSYSIAQLIERAIDSVRIQADSLDILINSDAADCQVTADGDRIVQTIVNLLSNALKFSPKNSTITVGTRHGDNWLEVRISDQGRGVPLEFQDKIFDRFQQVKNSDATIAGGSGLGLAICKAIIEQHGGTIGVFSQNGQGSTFWFRLPIAPTTRPLAKEVRV